MQPGAVDGSPLLGARHPVCYQSPGIPCVKYQPHGTGGQLAFGVCEIAGRRGCDSPGPCGSSHRLCGRRKMEDRVLACASRPDHAVFACYDGHGGDTAAEFCQERLHARLEKRLRAGESPETALR